MNGYGTPMMAGGGGLAQMLGGMLGGLRPRRNPAFMQEQQLLPFNGAPQLGSSMTGDGGLGAGMIGGMGGGPSNWMGGDDLGAGMLGGIGGGATDFIPGGPSGGMEQDQTGFGGPSMLGSGGGSNNLMQMLQQIMFRRGGRGMF